MSTELTQLRQRLDTQAELIRELSERIVALECRFELSIEPRHQAYTSWKAEVEADRKKVWLAGWGVAWSLATVVLWMAKKFYLP